MSSVIVPESKKVSQEWIDKITRELAEHVDDGRSSIAIYVSNSAEAQGLKNIVSKNDYFIEFWSREKNGQQYAVIDTHSISIPFDAFD
jgi:hypothetical protein